MLDLVTVEGEEGIRLMHVLLLDVLSHVQLLLEDQSYANNKTTDWQDIVLTTLGLNILC